VFGIQTGVAISFLVKRTQATKPMPGCHIRYVRRPEMETAEDKLAFLNNAKIASLDFEQISPDTRHNWINLTNNDFDQLLPVASKLAKQSRNSAEPQVIFRLFSQGVKTNRGEWVTAFSRNELLRRTNFLVKSYNTQLAKLRGRVDQNTIGKQVTYEIKWTRKLKKQLLAAKTIKFDPENATTAAWRPFVKKYLYFAWELNEDWYQLDSIFNGTPNPTIAFLCVFSSNPLAAMAVREPFDYCMLKMGNGGTECLPFWRLDRDGRRVENITDWALDQFSKRYRADRSKKDRLIGKEAIFHYVYSVFHDPIYREKYALNLKREFPRIPFYKDFWQWAHWGRELMDLHIGYESVTPAKLKRVDVPDEKARKAGLPPKCILKADKDGGRIIVDSETTLTDIPPEAWEYRLGNRSALEWILDQYKEKKPKDPTIREKFNTYRFADYKEKVVDLLSRVTTVSVQTVAVIDSMRKAPRH
jgi:predicted helicase